MKISELIVRLQALQAQHGDQPVCYLDNELWYYSDVEEVQFFDEREPPLGWDDAHKVFVGLGSPN